MMPPVLPSMAALLSSDDSLLERELRLAEVRRQAAVVRALLDTVQRFGPVSGFAPLAQMMEEMERLTGALPAAKGSAEVALASVHAAPPGQ